MKKAKITERALFQRLNRFLETEEGQVIKKCRTNSKWHNELGDYYIVDSRSGGIIRKDVDLEALGRELKVLSKHEAVGG